jgi:hypothetical protein
MSFLQSAGAGANAAASGVGHLFGTSGSNVSSIADKIGSLSNIVASAGGANPGYGGQAAPNNYMQYADPGLRAALAKFQPVSVANAAPMTYSGPNLQQLSANLPEYAR